MIINLTDDHIYKNWLSYSNYTKNVVLEAYNFDVSKYDSFPDELLKQGDNKITEIGYANNIINALMIKPEWKQYYSLLYKTYSNQPIINTPIESKVNLSDDQVYKNWLSFSDVSKKVVLDAYTFDVPISSLDTFPDWLTKQGNKQITEIGYANNTMNALMKKPEWKQYYSLLYKT